MRLQTANSSHPMLTMPSLQAYLYKLHAMYSSRWYHWIRNAKISYAADQFDPLANFTYILYVM